MKNTIKKTAVVGLAALAVGLPLSGTMTGFNTPAVVQAATVPAVNATYVGPITDNNMVFKVRTTILNADKTPVTGLLSAELVTLNADATVESTRPMSFTKLNNDNYDLWIDQSFVNNQFDKTFYIKVTTLTGETQLIMSGGEASSYEYSFENGNKAGIHASADKLLTITPVIDIATKFNGFVTDENSSLVKVDFNASYEYGEELDAVKVTLTSETTGWTYELDPNTVLWQNPTAGTQYHLWFDQGLLTYGETYSISITAPNGASELLYMADSTPVVNTLSNGKVLTAEKGNFDRLYITVS